MPTQNGEITHNLLKKWVFYDNEVYRLPFKAFIKEFKTVKGHISESSYTEWINNGKLGPVNKPKYKLMPTIFESMI